MVAPIDTSVTAGLAPVAVARRKTWRSASVRRTLAGVRAIRPLRLAQKSGLLEHALTIHRLIVRLSVHLRRSKVVD